MHASIETARNTQGGVPVSGFMVEGLGSMRAWLQIDGERGAQVVPLRGHQNLARATLGGRDSLLP